MKNFMKQIIFFFCCVMLYSIPSNATSVDADENKKIEINTPFAVVSDLYINQKTVEKNDVLKYQFTISFVDTFDYHNDYFDYGSFKNENADYYVIVTFKSPKKQEIVKRYKWSNASSALTIQDEILILDGIQAGEWKISHIRIDNYNSELSNAEGDRLTIYNGTQEENESYGGLTRFYTDLSFFNFTVTGVSKKVDNKAPTIELDSLKLSKRYIKKNKKKQKVEFSVKVEDASIIEEVKCCWNIYNYQNYFKEGCSEGDEHKMKYDKKTKRYQYTLKINTKHVRKKQLYSIYVRDIYGNEKYYNTYYDRYLPEGEKRKIYKAFKRMIIFAK